MLKGGGRSHLHDLALIFPVLDLVLHRPCTASHSGRIGSRWSIDHDLSDLSVRRVKMSHDLSHLSVRRVKNEHVKGQKRPSNAQKTTGVLAFFHLFAHLRSVSKAFLGFNWIMLVSAYTYQMERRQLERVRREEARRGIIEARQQRGGKQQTQ